MEGEEVKKERRVERNQEKGEKGKFIRCNLGCIREATAEDVMGQWTCLMFEVLRKTEKERETCEETITTLRETVQ